MAKRIILDLRGCPCPQPVLEIRKAMANHTEMEALVSDKDQVENIIRMADHSGWANTVEKEDGFYRIFLVEKETSLKTNPQSVDLNTIEAHKSKSVAPSVLLISTEYMGRGDDDLGRILMRAFLATIKECSQIPQTIILLNSGVKLAVKGSPSIEALKELEAEGIKILVCGTCLDFYRFKEDLKVGTVSNMFDIADTMLAANVLNVS